MHFISLKQLPRLTIRVATLQLERDLRVIRKDKRAAEIRLAEECKGDLKKFFSFL